MAKARKRKFPNFAVFGFGRYGVMLIRTPTRTYGYGAVLYAYLVALYYARERRLAVCFLARRGELGVSLRSLSAVHVHVLSPSQPLLGFMWLLWGFRLAWAQISSPGRTRRWTNTLVAGAASVTASLEPRSRRRTRVNDALKSLKTRLTERAKAQPQAEELRVLRIEPATGEGIDAVHVDLGGPSVLARVRRTDEAACRHLAAALGIDPDRPTVALHIREPGWRASYYKRGDRPGDAVRNAAPETYRPAIEYLRQIGYQVVRLGDPTMSRFEAEGLVDLAFSRADSLFEFWVVGRSAFMIGSDSGPSILANLSGTPLLTVNAVHLAAYMALPPDRFICKLAYRPNTTEPMTLAEMVDRGYTSSKLAPNLSELEAPYRDNTPEEILDAVKEMLAVVSLPHGEAQPTPAQLAYHDILAEGCLRLFMSGEGQICGCFAERWLGVDVQQHASADTAS